MAKKTSKEIIHEAATEVGANIGKIARNQETSNELLAKILLEIGNSAEIENLKSEVKTLNQQILNKEETINGLNSALTNASKIKHMVLRSQDVLRKIGGHADNLGSFTLRGIITLKDFPAKTGWACIKKSNSESCIMRQIHGGEGLNVAEMLTVADLKANVDIDIFIIHLPSDLESKALEVYASLN